jgi:hypothetical protein
MRHFFIGTIVLLVLLNNLAIGQNSQISDYFPDINILESNGPSEGYFFMGSKGLSVTNGSHYIAIIDNYGTPVFFRKMNKPTSSVRLLHDGRIAYLNGIPRKLFILNDMLEVTDTLAISGFKPNGHDWDVGEDGEILLMGEAASVVDMSKFVEGGDSLAEKLDLVVQEFDLELNLVSSWNSADHFEVTDGNENSPYLDFTEKQIDYVHANGISIDSDTSFLISCRHMDEITKVDRRTGEIIWRLGGKQNQFQFVNDDLRFSHQHSIRALPNGNILLFDNGNLRAPQLSSAVEYSIDEKNKIATLERRFYRNPAVYSNHQGTTQRVHNGNTIVNWGPYWPSFTEFNADGTTALEWDFTEHSFCPRIEKFIWQTKVFELDSDSVNFGVWENDTLFQPVWIKNNSGKSMDINTIESRTDYFNITGELPITIAAGDSIQLEIWFNPEYSETSYFDDVLTIASDTENKRIAQQVFLTGYKHESIVPTAQIISETSQVAINSKIQIKFSEPLRTIEGNVFDNRLIDSYVILKEDDFEGVDVLFNATISSDKTLVTIIPEIELKTNATYFLSLKSGLSDFANNSLASFESVISTMLTITNSVSSFENTNKVLIYPKPVVSTLNNMLY